MSRFALAPQRKHQAMRRNLSAVLLGLLLFLGSLAAVRLRPERATLFLVFGAAGAGLFVVGLRRLLVGMRPLTVARNAVWFGTRGVPLAQVEAIEVEGRRLVLHAGGKRREEELADPALAAAEIASRAGLRPPRKGGPQRWERRASTAVAEAEEERG